MRSTLNRTCPLCLGAPACAGVMSAGEQPRAVGGQPDERR